MPCGQTLGLTGGGEPDLDPLEGAVGGAEHTEPLTSHLAPPPSLGGPLRLLMATLHSARMASNAHPAPWCSPSREEDLG